MEPAQQVSIPEIGSSSKRGYMSISRNHSDSDAQQTAVRGNLERDSHRTDKKRKASRPAADAAQNVADRILSNANRRNSISKAARDPRDQPTPSKKSISAGTVTRSPSPVIDFDGLSRPSM
jgi:GTP cyclohydrolase IA